MVALAKKILAFRKLITSLQLFLLAIFIKFSNCNLEKMDKFYLNHFAQNYKSAVLSAVTSIEFRNGSDVFSCMFMF